MKNKVKLKKYMPHLDEEVRTRIEEIISEHGKSIDDLSVERKSITKAFHLEPGSRTAVTMISTRDCDDIGDVVIPKGVNLKIFKESGMPVFWSHNISAPPIGSDINIKAVEMGIQATTQLADTGEGTLANIIWSLIQQGHQKQSSIGIIPIEVVRRDEEGFDVIAKQLSKIWPEFKKNIKNVKRIILKSILFEHSFVGLGMNIHTDVLAVSKMSKLFKDEGANDDLLKQLGLNVDVEDKDKDANKDEESKNTISDTIDTTDTTDIIDTTVDINIKDILEDKENVDNKEATEKDEKEEVEELIPESKHVKVVNKASEKVHIKVISKPSVLKTSIKNEIRRNLGKLF